VWDANRTNLGQLDTVIRTVFGVNNPNIRARIIAYLGWQAGVSIMLCTVAGRAAALYWDEFMSTAGQTITLTNRAQLEVRWGGEYQPGGSAAAIGDAWEAIGRPRNWCISFGSPEGECCHAEDAATNNARRANLTSTSVSVRSQATGAN